MNSWGLSWLTSWLSSWGGGEQIPPSDLIVPVEMTAVFNPNVTMGGAALSSISMVASMIVTLPMTGEQA